MSRVSVVPRAGENRLAKPQAVLHISGSILFWIGIALVTTRGRALRSSPIVGSVTVVGADLATQVILFQTSQS